MSEPKNFIGPLQAGGEVDLVADDGILKLLLGAGQADGGESRN